MKNRAHRDLVRFLAVAMAAGFASCHAKGSEEARSPVSTFTPGFALRQDVKFGTGGINEAIVVDLDGDGMDDVLQTDFFDRKINSALSNPDGSFTPFFTLPTPSTVWQIELGDYNGDGIRDISAICTATDGGIYAVVVYRGLGDGSFVQDAVLELDAEPYDFTTARLPGFDRDHLFITLPADLEIVHVELTSSGVLTELAALPSSDAATFVPFTVAAVDANGDGARDIIVGEMNGPGTGSDRIVTHAWDAASSIFLAPIVQEPIAAAPVVRAVGDVDGDGFEELAVPQMDSDRALLLIGSPSGLGSPIEIPFSSTTASIVFDDLDGDGIKDVAASMYDEDAIGVRIATAPFVYGDLAVYNVGGHPRSVAVGLFGQGQVKDLFCSNIRDVSVLHGDGTGNFNASRGFPIGDDPLFVRPVDLDGDGNMDIVSMDFFKGKVVFMRGNGDGTFDNAGQIPLDPSSLEWPGFLIVRDFDEDGLLDVATAVNSSDRVQIMRNPGSLSFSEPVVQAQIPVGRGPIGLDAGDIDNDGHQDVVVANSGADNIQVLLGHGDASFSARGAVPSPYLPLVVLLGDWDGDGNLDVAVTTRALDGTDTHLLLFRGDGTGDLSLVAQQPLPRFSPVLHMADFDEDGLPDIVGSQPDVDADELLVLINRGDFTFDVRPLKVGFQMGTLEVTDANLDGHQDILALLSHGQLVIALGDGSGGFPVLLPPNGEQFPAPRGAITSALADVDNDGLPDLLTVSPKHEHLWVALNRGTPFQ